MGQAGDAIGGEGQGDAFRLQQRLVLLGQTGIGLDQDALEIGAAGLGLGGGATTPFQVAYVLLAVLLLVPIAEVAGRTRTVPVDHPLMQAARGIGVIMDYVINHSAAAHPLFVAARLAKVGIGEITRHLWPLMAATFVVVLLVTYLPQLSLWLPRLIQSF